LPEPPPLLLTDDAELPPQDNGMAAAFAAGQATFITPARLCAAIPTEKMNIT